MTISRRDFLKLVGCSSLALVSAKSLFATSTSVLNEKSNGKRLSLVIDLAGCGKKEDCRECIDACHRIHNVPQFNNGKDDIKWIWSEPFDEVFPEQQASFDRASQERGHTSQTSLDRGHTSRPAALGGMSPQSTFGGMSPQLFPTLVLCNHCEKPPCVSVCPTKATFKRADGIVMMDYHRCIGCRYCMAACPYGARSFNWRDPRQALRNIDSNYPTRTRGVVEKCNLCDERLAKGLMPACVEACKEKALIFGDVNDPASDVRKALTGRLVLRRKPGLGTGPSVYYVV
jgi:Fe-S-cluster-containing dehydrogenase component